MCRGSKNGGPDSSRLPSSGNKGGDLPNDKNTLLVGHIIKPHGLKGDLRVKAWQRGTLEQLIRKRLEFVSPEGRWVFTLLNAITRNKDVLLTLDGVKTRNQADLLRGAEVRAFREDLPPLDKEEFFLADAVGASVVDEKGDPLGNLQGFEENPAGPLLIIVEGEEEILLPIRGPFIIDWDDKEQILQVSVPEGMPKNRRTKDRN